MSLINQYEKKILSFNDKKNQIKVVNCKKFLDNKWCSKKSQTHKFINENNIFCDEIENNNISNDFYKLEYLSNIGELIIEQYDIKPRIDNNDEIENKIIETKETFPTNQQMDNILDYFDKPVKKIEKQKSKLNKYNFIINNGKIEDNEFICPNCKQEINQILVDNKLVCKFCGFSKNETLFCSPENNEMNKKIIYPYKRLNHLKECLNQLQAKESINVPVEIKEKINKELQKRKIKLEDTKYEDVKNIIKALKLNKYYDHYIYLTVIITGKQPMTLKKQEEKEIIIMFQNILNAYETIETKTRINFLNYYYVLHKIFEIKNNHEFIKYCPLLKSNDKLIQQDMIWKQICKKLNWKYIASI